MELWVNLKNRELHGIVDPGMEYDELINYVKKELHRWHDPKTGKKVVDKIYEKTEIYHGKYLDTAPDILIIFNNNLIVNGIALKNNESDELLVVETPEQIESTNNISGVHIDNGYFLMSGNNIKHDIKLDKIEIIDIAPTILSLLGQAIPADMDGKVITDAFEEQIKIKIDDRTDKDKGYNSLQDTTGAYSDEDAEIIKDRLKGLGYIK